MAGIENQGFPAFEDAVDGGEDGDRSAKCVGGEGQGKGAGQVVVLAGREVRRSRRAGHRDGNGDRLAVDGASNTHLACRAGFDGVGGDDLKLYEAIVWEHPNGPELIVPSEADAADLGTNRHCLRTGKIHAGNALVRVEDSIGRKEWSSGV